MARSRFEMEVDGLSIPARYQVVGRRLSNAPTFHENGSTVALTGLACVGMCLEAEQYNIPRLHGELSIAELQPWEADTYKVRPKPVW